MISLRKINNLGSRNLNRRNYPTKLNILLVGQNGGENPLLPKIMSILFEGYYDPRLCKAYIYQVILDTISATLDKMVELSLPFRDQRVKALALVFTSQQSMVRLGEMIKSFGNLLLLVWDDMQVKRCYRDSIEVTAHPSAT